MNASPAIPGFDFQPRTRLVFGVDAAMKVGELAKALPATRVLLVTDRGIVGAGHAAIVQRALEAAGLHVVTYDGVRENPTTRDVDECLAVARAGKIDAIVGLGGGSAMDTAKGCNFLLTGGGRMQDYWGVGKAKAAMLPLVAIPTTAGTGSECQSFALIADESTHQKMACGDPRAAPRVAVLDPSLTLTQPRRVTACTGIDALAHAVETAVTKSRTPLSMMHSREALRLCMANLERVLSPQGAGDVDARAGMQLGAALAGAAIENSMLGAAHAAANPLTAHHHIVHGQAVGLMLPPVMRFNAADRAAADAYADLAVLGGLSHGNGDRVGLVDALVVRVTALLSTAGLLVPLRELGVTERDLPALAAEAATQWTAKFNPREVTAADFEAMYRAAL